MGCQIKRGAHSQREYVRREGKSERWDTQGRMERVHVASVCRGRPYNGQRSMHSPVSSEWSNLHVHLTSTYSNRAQEDRPETQGVSKVLAFPCCRTANIQEACARRETLLMIQLSTRQTRHLFVSFEGSSATTHVQSAWHAP